MTETLVQQGFLKSSGHGRGMRYCLPGKKTPDLFSEMDVNSEHYDQKLFELAAPVCEKGKANRELVKSIILQLCSGHYLELRALSTLLNRSPETIRTHYVISMVEQKLLELRYPEQLNHPKQAYKTRIENQ
jgi:ATP-dependent DNA helicase RecG